MPTVKRFPVFPTLRAPRPWGSSHPQDWPPAGCRSGPWEEALSTGPPSESVSMLRSHHQRDSLSTQLLARNLQAERKYPPLERVKFSYTLSLYHTVGPQVLQTDIEV